MLRRALGIGFICVAAILSGCGSATSDGLVSAKGTVTLDGTALAKGTIRFMPADSVTPSVDASIDEGKFATRLPKGKLTVIINSGKKIGEQRIYEEDPKSPMTDIMKEIIPDKYNVKSTLALEVGDKALENVSYDLKSK